MSFAVTENCPICGGQMCTYHNADQKSPFSSKLTSKTMCSSCGYEKPEIPSYTYVNSGYGYVVGKCKIAEDLLAPKTIQICGCEKIILKDKSLDFVFELSRGQIEDFDEIIINGIKFKKEI